MNRYFATTCATVALSSLLLGTAQAQQIFSGSGLNAATAFGDFKTAIGGVNNGGGGGPQTGGFRTIDWDAVKLDGTDFGGNTTVIDLNHTIGIPTNRFQARGVVFEEVYAVSGDQFATVNPATAGQFNNFSPSNTFVMFDQTNGQFEDRFIDQHFTLAGTTTLAGTRGSGSLRVGNGAAGGAAIAAAPQEVGDSTPSGAILPQRAELAAARGEEQRDGERGCRAGKRQSLSPSVSPKRDCRRPARCCSRAAKDISKASVQSMISASSVGRSSTRAKKSFRISS